MKFSDITLITEDMRALAEFYEALFGIAIEKSDVHTQFEVGGLRITLYSQQAAQSDMGFDFTQHNGTGKLTISFTLDEIDNTVPKLNELDIPVVAGPKTYPWGTRAVHFRDPDGNIICFRCWPKT